MSRLHPKDAAVAGLWAGINAVLAGMLIAFWGPTAVWRLAMYWAAVAIVVLFGLAVLRPRPHRPHRSPAGGTGAPSLALALACLVGGLAWVFGVYLAYFALPLLAFCVGRWRLERQAVRP